MGAVFSSSSSSGSKPANKKVQVTSVDRTILDLKNSRDRLQRYRTKLETDLDRLVVQAKAAKLHGRNETALGLLRLRKFKRDQLQNCEDQLLNVMQLVETIGSRQNDAQMLAAMKNGKDALKLLHEETTVDDILNLMEAIQEEHEVEQEVSDILQNVPKLSADAEYAVEQELAALEESMLPSLPVAPDTKLPEIKTSEVATTAATTAAVAAAKKPARVAVPG
jgi:charged multivesicular body protein 6